MKVYLNKMVVLVLAFMLVLSMFTVSIAEEVTQGSEASTKEKRIVLIISDDKKDTVLDEYRSQLASAAGILTAVLNDTNTEISIADEGSYTLCFEMNGFIAENKEVTIRKDNRITCDAALSPEMQSDQYRVVLTWGSRPTDLDSHLIWSKDHIYFSHKISSESDARLDLDDTHSYGPETTTFTMLPGETYKFFVHNFSDEASMANCGARVAIYCGTNHLATRTVPASGNGRYWEVFTLRDGEITYGEQIQAREPELNS